MKLAERGGYNASLLFLLIFMPDGLAKQVPRCLF